MQRQQAPPTYLNYRNGSVPNGSTPNANSLPQPTVSPPRPPPPPPPVAAPPSAPQSTATNTLLIFISGAPSPDIAVYLSTILSRYSMSEISIIATTDEVLKLTRMAVYTAAGKAKQDIQVSTSRVNRPIQSSEIRRATEGLTSKVLCGVLCCQHSDDTTTEADASQPRDILDYDEAELEESWRTNFMTLHTLARITIPLLQKAPTNPSPFFSLDSSLTLSPLDTISQDSLLQQLAVSPLSQGLRFGPAKEELIPAVVPAPLALDIPNSRNGSVYGGNPNTSSNSMYYSPDDEYRMSPLSESPTKLWASWAMMNDS